MMTTMDFDALGAELRTWARESNVPPRVYAQIVVSIGRNCERRSSGFGWSRWTEACWIRSRDPAKWWLDTIAAFRRAVA